MLLNKYLSYVTQEDVETSRPLTLVQLLLPGWWSLLRLMFSSVACHNYLIFLSFYFFFNYLYYFFFKYLSVFAWRQSFVLPHWQLGRWLPWNGCLLLFPLTMFLEKSVWTVLCPSSKATEVARKNSWYLRCFACVWFLFSSECFLWPYERRGNDSILLFTLAELLVSLEQFQLLISFLLLSLLFESLWKQISSVFRLFFSLPLQKTKQNKTTCLDSMQICCLDFNSYLC